MNLSFSISADLKNELLNADVDFAADTFSILLMRDGFSFNASNHSNLINLQTNSGAINYTVAASGKTYTRSSGSWITNGFVPNNYITTDGVNNGVYQVTSVTALVMRVKYISGTAITDETAVAKTVTSDDEMAAGSGYSTGGFNVTWTISGNELYLNSFDMSTGGSFGTARDNSQGAVIYDETATGDPVVCYCKFNSWRVSV